MTYSNDYDYSKLPDGHVLLNKQNSSELYLKAVLYLLEDPALDRNAFEELLAADDGQLAELLSSAVYDLKLLKQSQSCFAGLGDQVREPVQLTSQNNTYFSSRMAWLSTIVASCVVVGFVGWQFVQNRSVERVAQTSIRYPDFPSDDSLVPIDALNIAERSSMVQAWTEFRVVDDADAASSNGLISDPDCILCLHRDAPTELDVPEWLVQAASALGLDSIESDVN
jgi:hypothetical protein